jgi:uncharacterized protein with HEPN domain
LPFRDNPTHFRDILDAIDHIGEFLNGIDFEAYQEDLKTKSAVERQMQIITEAAHWVRMGRRWPPASIGRVFAGWAIFYDMRTIASMIRSSGTQSRMNYPLCKRL